MEPERQRRGSRFVQVVRGYEEDDGLRLVFGAALMLAGPQLARLAGQQLLKVGILEPRNLKTR